MDSRDDHGSFRNPDDTMLMVDLIAKKRDGGKLSRREIASFVGGLVAGDIPDYQTAALLMAIYWRGLEHDEIVALTEAMADSGARVDLSGLPGIKVDKHSTGGVADTTTIVLVPLIGSVGLSMAKMSGRGLGHTGGTIDKLESIPGFAVDFTAGEMIELVRKTGVALVEQTADLVPADKLIYALRDVTGTTSHIGLIASSVMSKKLAAGSDRILLDVKTGRGAFLPRWEDTVELARVMVEIGESCGVRTVALLSNMDQPLGTRIGNSLEILEAIELLSGKRRGDLLDLVLYLGAELLLLADQVGSHREGVARLDRAISSGAALEKFRQMIIAQGGDGRVVDDPGLLPMTASSYPITSDAEGYIQSIETRAMGRALVNFGVGRTARGMRVDPALGVTLHKRLGDHVRKGEVLMEVAAHSGEAAATMGARLREMYHLGTAEPAVLPIIRGRVDRLGYHEL